MKFKKFILIGAIASISLPILTTVSCAQTTAVVPKNTVINSQNYMKYSTYNAETKTLRVDENVVSIEPYSFEHYFDKRIPIWNLILPNSLTNIVYNVFDSFRLKELFLGSGLKNIGYGAFASATLTSLFIPNSVQSIGDGAFQCSLLTHLIIPNNVISIGEMAFYNSILTTLKLGNNLLTIGNQAFRYSILTKLILPNKLQSIGGSAFFNSKITRLIVPTSVTRIHGSAFEFSPINKLTFRGPCRWYGLVLGDKDPYGTGTFGQTHLQAITATDWEQWAETNYLWQFWMRW